MAETSKETISDTAKRLIADPAQRIALDDFINPILQDTIGALNTEHFPLNEVASNEGFVKRVVAYEAAIQNVQTLAILLARWGNPEQLLLLEKIFARMAEVDKGNGGVILWLRLGWYPILVLMYSAGMAALSARRYDALHTVFATRVRGQLGMGDLREKPVIIPTVDGVTEIEGSFKLLPGHERHRVPRSEHLFAELRRPLDDALFLGGSYERVFDRFEVFLALTFADARDPSGERPWGPLGRFSYKLHGQDNPLGAVIEEVQERKNDWPPLAHGFFGGSFERFQKIAGGFTAIVAQRVW